MKPLIISGPSGGGKSTIITKAMEAYPDAFAFSISHTTRKPRPEEVDGINYWFVTEEKFKKMINDGEFLEYATFGGSMYGTSKKALDDVLKTERICIVDVELQGVKSIHGCKLDAKYILIKTPTLEILEQRLRSRKTETEESLTKRLNHAKEDLDAVSANPELFDFVIVNDNLERAYNEFLKIIENELDIVMNAKKK
ncbi:unnamed protein product [Thelazia callipaeda]|uniref:guanylate kinase n=1 Tax=Thelazia callipaeda TaxID=103827 RepID=A0A0N5CJU5_THECL|nr:unnamed protein product [Thelazia callipaeda]